MGTSQKWLTQKSPKDWATRKREFDQRQREQGRKPVQIWLTDDEARAVRQFVKNFRKHNSEIDSFLVNWNIQSPHMKKREYVLLDPEKRRDVIRALLHDLCRLLGDKPFVLSLEELQRPISDAQLRKHRAAMARAASPLNA